MMIARVIRFYGMDYRAVMALPMRVFWHLSGSVDRLSDLEDKRRLELQVAGASPDGAMQMIEVLNKRTPDAIKFTEKAIIEAHIAKTSERDPDAAEVLRSLGG